MAVPTLSARRRVVLVGCAEGALEPTGGLEIFLLRLAHELAREHDVHVASLPHPDACGGSPRRPGEAFTRHEPAHLDELHRLASSADIVMVNQWRHLVTVPEKTVLMLHGGIEHCYPEELATVDGRARLVDDLTRPAVLAACSRWAADTLGEVSGRDTVALYPPLDPTFLSTPVVAKRPVVGYVGRLSLLKGADIVPAIARHPGLGPLSVEMTDFQPDEGLVELFHEERTRGDVHMVGPFTEARHLAVHMASLAVLLVPSRVEGFGLSALEAQAAGTFVVASDVGGLRESVLPGGGVNVDGGIGSLVEAVKEHAYRRPEPAVRDLIRERFTVRATAERFLSLL